MKLNFFNESVNIKKGTEGTKEIEGTWKKQKALRVTEELLDLLSKSYCV